VALFASRTIAALLLTLAILAAALVVATTMSIALAGSAHAPSTSEVIQRNAAVLGFGASCALVCTGLAAFARTRGPMMASVIALGVVVSELLLRTSFLGSLEVCCRWARLTGTSGTRSRDCTSSLALAIAVLAAWALAALAAGGWWSRRVEV
jgi:hypothetical protein